MSAKPTAEIDLVNLALMQLHQGEVTSLLDSNDPLAQLALKAVAMVRRGLLRSSTLWNFAKQRASASRVTTATPAFDFDSFYTLPNDCLRIHRIGELAADKVSHDIQGRYLCLQDTEPSVYLTYTRDEEDINKWDALFVEAFVIELAIWLCFPVTGDRAIQRELRSRLTEILSEAATVDLQEKPLDIEDYSRPQLAREDAYSVFSDISVVWPDA